MTSVKDVVEFRIDNTNYKLTLLCTSRAFITGQELVKLGLPSVGAAFDGMMSEELYEDNQTFSAIAIHMKNQLGNVDVLKIIIELLENLSANDIPVDFETYFKGRLGLLVDVLTEAVRENYSGLFTETSLKIKLMTYIREFQAQLTPPNAEVQTELE
ncbi:MAG: hypothetical protein GY804_11810 [Alphaproteobacteria bacterium]|nr:hypothetical protein [Alphaproteobacteria bacterium]